MQREEQVPTGSLRGGEEFPEEGAGADALAGGLGGFQGQDLADLIRQHLESSRRMLEKLDPLI